MPTAAASVACAAPRVSLRAASKRRTAIAKPPASRRSTRSCARGRAAELCPRASLAPSSRRASSPAPSEISLGGKLRAVCQVFFPPRATPRQAVKDRLNCVLTLDRATLLPEEEQTMEERVRAVMGEFLELEHGVNGADLAAPTVTCRLDETSGSRMYNLQYRVKGTRPSSV